MTGPPLSAPTPLSHAQPRNSDTPPPDNGSLDRPLRKRGRRLSSPRSRPAKSARREASPVPFTLPAVGPTSTPALERTPSPTEPATSRPGSPFQASYLPPSLANLLTDPQHPTTPRGPTTTQRPDGPERATPARHLRLSKSWPSPRKRKNAVPGWGGHCPLCSLLTPDVLTHLRAVHAHEALDNQILNGTGLVACACKKPFRGGHGLNAHLRSGSCAAQRPAGPDEQVPPLLDGLSDAEIEAIHLRLAPLPVTRRKFDHTIANAFQRAAEGSARAFMACPNAENLAYFEMLPKTGLTPAMRRHPRVAVKRLYAYPRVPWPETMPDRPPPATSEAAKDASAHRLVAQGRLSTATRVLTSDETVADPSSSPDVQEALRAKHPRGPDSPFAGVAASGAQRLRPVIPTAEQLETELARFKTDTAPGPSGWTVPLLRMAMKSEAVVEMLVYLAGEIALGSAPGRSSLTAARLIPLSKPDGGVRPIAVGDLLYRLIMKAILRCNFRRTMLLPCQYGVQTPGGVDPIIHAVRNAAFGSRADGSRRFTHLVSLDFSNAFNTMDRTAVASAVNAVAPELLHTVEWAYGSASDLLLADGTSIASSQGVRQGCPLGPFLFSLGLRGFLLDLVHEFGGDVVLAYLDDLYILCTSANALERVEAIVRRHQGLGLRLNRAKSSCTSLETIRNAGLDLLGSHVGTPASTADFLAEKIDAEARRVTATQRLTSQRALLLLLGCLQHDLRHLQRSLAPSPDADRQWCRLDTLLGDAVLRLRGVSPEPSRDRCDLARRLLALPARLGGLGLSSHLRVAPHAYGASLAAAASAFGAVGPLLGFSGLPEGDATLSQRERCQPMHQAESEAIMAALTGPERIAVAENASYLGRRWLRVIPWCTHLEMDRFAVGAGLRARTLTYEAVAEGPHCSWCRRPAGLGHAELCSGRTLGQKEYTHRHTLVVRAVGEALKSLPDASAFFEPSIDTVDGGVRYDDILFIGSPSSGLQSTTMDITVVSLFAEARVSAVQRRLETGGNAESDQLTNAQTACRYALTDAALDKRRRHPGSVDRTPFMPFVLSTGGLLEGEAEAAVNRWRPALRTYANGFMLDRIAVGLQVIRGRTSAVW